LGKSFLLTKTSNLYYLTALTAAQDALNLSPKSGTPTWPPTAQNMSTFLAIMGAIGKGIGNGAAHEIGHHLQQIRPSMGGLFHVNQQFPYMDCGMLNSDFPCQDGNNFVYNFWTANGGAQGPGDLSGGSFFYVDIPGHPIHWGRDNVCWLVNWTGPGTCEF
jgi:hypothetical protein